MVRRERVEQIIYRYYTFMALIGEFKNAFA